MLWVREVTIQKQESVSLVTTIKTATLVIPESGLVQEGILMTPTRVETRLDTNQIMGTETSKPWDTFWYTENELITLNNNLLPSGLVRNW